MTEADKQLVVDNIKLVYKFCSTHNISDEDIIQELVLAVCSGIDKFDASRGELSTFVFATCMNKLKYLYRKEQVQRRVPEYAITSLEAPVNNSEGEDTSLGELLGFYDVELDKVMSEDFKDSFISAYKKQYPNNTKVLSRISRYLGGASLYEISVQDGVSLAAVCENFRKLKEFYECYSKNNYSSLRKKRKN